MSSAILTPGANLDDSSPNQEPVGQLAQLTTKKMARLFGSEQIVTLLVELELSVYVGEPNHYYVGFADEGAHSHDRWLWLHRPLEVQVSTSGPPLIVGNWFEHNAHPGALREEDATEVKFPPVSVGVITDLLRHYKQLVGEVRMRLLLHEGQIIGPTEVLSAAVAMNSLDVNDLVAVDYSLSPVEMHNLVHHSADFVAQHPDHGGIPRQNLLAIYGLTDPYRLVRAGRESV